MDVGSIVGIAFSSVVVVVSVIALVLVLFIRPKTENVAQPNAPIVDIVQSTPTPTTIKDHFLKVGLSEAAAEAVAGTYGQPTTYTRSPRHVREALKYAWFAFLDNPRSEAKMEEMTDIVVLPNNSEIHRRLAKLIPTFSYKDYINFCTPLKKSTLKLPINIVRYAQGQPSVVYSENHGGGTFNIPINPWHEPISNSTTISNIAERSKNTRKKKLPKLWEHVRK